MPSHRLDQFLAARGFGSRKDALRLIRKGAVCVNGLVAKSGAEKIHPESDRVDVSGKAIPMMDGCYLMLHKPKGVISASRDPKVATVLELIPEELRRRGLF
ncbi:MAG: 16S rRNA pseudouridine(516) synthase, partial [Oscillospiraceae bacterium]|nr:16S rRNA pseudouridine(516) synthase [Oscillospiraceae bacterium]